MGIVNLCATHIVQPSNGASMVNKYDPFRVIKKITYHWDNILSIIIHLFLTYQIWADLGLDSLLFCTICEIYIQCARI